TPRHGPRQLGGLLEHPGRARIRRAPGEMHAAAAQLEEEQDVEPLQPDRLDPEEIDGQQAVSVYPDEFAPRRFPALTRRAETRRPKPRADGRREHGDAQPFQFTDNGWVGFGFSRGVVEDDVDVVLLLSSAPPRQDEPPALTSSYGRELARRRALHQATLPFRGAKIRFEESRAAFATDADEPLQAVVSELFRDRGVRLLVKAFADPTESNAVALSTLRAELLVDWLAARGVEPHRLVPKGCAALRALTFG